MAGKPEPIDPAAKAYAVAEVAKGRGLRDVAEELVSLGYKCSHMKVQRWCDDAKAQPAAPPTPDTPALPPPTPPAPLSPTVDPDAPFDYLASLHAMVRQADAEAREMALASNPRGQQAAMRRAGELMKLIGQVEKQKPQDPDVLSFSRAEIDRTFAELEALLLQLCSREVLCSECTRKLSVRFGRGQ